MTLFNIISCAIISVGIGRGYPRWLAVGAFIALLCLNQPTIGYILAWLYAFTIIRLLPTAGLLTCISVTLPPDDGGIARRWLRKNTTKVYHLLANTNYVSNEYIWGFLYGFIRTLPVLPAAYYLNAPLLYLMPFIGVIYCACGKVFCGRTGDVLKDNTRAVIAAEIVTLGIMGASL